MGDDIAPTHTVVCFGSVCEAAYTSSARFTDVVCERLGVLFGVIISWKGDGEVVV